jgi:hypothetical protein
MNDDQVQVEGAIEAPNKPGRTLAPYKLVRSPQRKQGNMA